MINLTLQQGYSIVTMVSVASLTLFLVCFAYRRAYRMLSTRQGNTLLGLRLCAVVLVLLLLFRPVFSFERVLTHRPELIFLLDRSASMGIVEDSSGENRFHRARTWTIQWSSQLQDEYDVRWATFSESCDAIDDITELKELEPNGLVTSLSRALKTARQTARSPESASIVLITDGVDNTVTNPATTAKELGIKISTIGVGGSLHNARSYRDVTVTAIECPNQIPVNNRVRIVGFVDAVGFEGRVLPLTLREDDSVVDSQELVLDGIDGPQEVTFEFVPSSKGRHIYDVRFDKLADERIEENNQRATVAIVVDARIRVLYVEGTLRSEYGALVGRFLSKDPNVEFCSLVQTRPNIFMQRSNIEGLMLDAIPNDQESIDGFDVIILGDLDSSYLKPEQMDLIYSHVNGGAGLIMLGGYHSLGPGGYAGTPIEQLLPVTLGPRGIGQITQPFNLTLTAEGVRHPIFANIAEFFPTDVSNSVETGLSPLEGCVRVARVKPAASVLAMHPSQLSNGDSPLPVLAVQPFGKGRTGVFTADTTRNWHQTLRALDQETPFLRFWGQVVRWLAGRTESVSQEASLIANSDKAFYEPGESVTLTAIARDNSGEGTSDLPVSAEVTEPNGDEMTVRFTPAAGPTGHYVTTFEAAQSGTYQIEVRADTDDGMMTAGDMIVDVGRPNLEFDRLDLDEDTLREISRESGGSYEHLSTAHRMFRSLKREKQQERVAVELPLYWPPLFWISFVGLVSSEWILRRRYHLR